MITWRFYCESLNSNWPTCYGISIVLLWASQHCVSFTIWAIKNQRMSLIPSRWQIRDLAGGEHQSIIWHHFYRKLHETEKIGPREASLVFLWNIKIVSKGRSRILPKGRILPKWVCLAIVLYFLPKTAWKLKNLNPKGRTSFVDPLNPPMVNCYKWWN